ncbi:efflux RND transporter periplasmic adaptor subunit [Chloroflexota bacterium]
MKNKVKMGLVLAVLSLSLLGVTACDSGGEGATQQLVKVERGDLAVSVTGSGKIEATRDARLTFGSAGKVDKILVKEGDEVFAGDVLAELDTYALELALAQSQVALTQAEVALTQARLAQNTAEYNLKNTRDTEDALELAVFNAQISLETAQEALADTVRGYGWDEYESIEAELRKSEAYYDTIQKRIRDSSTGTDAWVLLLEGAEDRLEQAQVDFDNFLAGHANEKLSLKKKQVEAADFALAQTRKNLDDLAEDIALQELQIASAEQSVVQAGQSVELARKSLDEAQRQLDEATIIASFDGIVAQVLVKEGDNIPSPSMAPTTVVYLIAPGYIELVVEVDEIDIPLVKFDQEAVVSVDALSGMEFAGKVTAVYPVPKEVGGVVLYEVRMALEAPGDSGIKVGMSASADIMMEERSNVLVVPSRAVGKNDQGETVVKVMSGEEEVQEKPVVVGLDDGLRTEIISGLSEGETVVIELRAKASSSSLF